MKGAEYWDRNGKIYWNRSLIKEADIGTFQPFNDTWARDQNHVYQHDRILRAADIQTFTVLNALYAKDCNHIFYLSGKVKDADHQTFRVLDLGYHETDIPNGQTSKSFQGFAADKDHVFHYVLTIGKPNKLKSANPTSFKPLKWAYGSDGTHVYRERYLLPKADPASFEALSRTFSRDRRYVYYCERMIDGADANTFEVIDAYNYLAKDQHRHYKRDIPIEPSPTISNIPS